MRKSIALHSSHGGAITNEGRESPYVVHVLHVKPQTKVERPRMKSLWYNMSFYNQNRGRKAQNVLSAVCAKQRQRRKGI